MIKPVFLPRVGHYAHFTHRDAMRRKAAVNSFRALGPIPPTALPVDSLGPIVPVFNMDDNDNYGTCGPAMCDHVHTALLWRQGRGIQASPNVPSLLSQYLKVSGGDNGTSEDDLVGPQGIWTAGGGGLAGDSSDVIIDYLDIDVTNIPLTQYAIDQWYAIEMAWSVPDEFANNWAPGTVWPNAMIPDPANGHFTPLMSVSAAGFYEMPTWGGLCSVGPKMVASVQPQCFVAISPRQFDPKSGLDSKGRHVSVQAAKWVAFGGSAAKMATLVAMFPPVPPPSPSPTPTPTPHPTPTPTPGPTPAGGCSWDVATKTVVAPGYKAKPHPLPQIIIGPTLKEVLHPHDWTVKT